MWATLPRIHTLKKTPTGHRPIGVASPRAATAGVIELRHPSRQPLCMARVGALAALGAALTLGGCGYTARDAHLAKRSAAVNASAGDGSIAVVRAEIWPDDQGPATALAEATVVDASP